MSSKKAPVIYFYIIHDFFSRMWLSTKSSYHLGHILVTILVILTKMQIFHMIQQFKILIARLTQHHNSRCADIIFRQTSIVLCACLLDFVKSSAPCFYHTALKENICQLRIIRLGRVLLILSTCFLLLYPLIAPTTTYYTASNKLIFLLHLL